MCSLIPNHAAHRLGGNFIEQLNRRPPVGIPIRTDETAALIGGLAPLTEGEQYYAARPEADGTIVLTPITAEDYQALCIQRFASEQLGLDLAAAAIVGLIKNGTVYARGGPVAAGRTPPPNICGPALHHQEAHIDALDPLAQAIINHPDWHGDVPAITARVGDRTYVLRYWEVARIGDSPTIRTSWKAESP